MKTKTPKPPAKPTVKSLTAEVTQVRAELAAAQQRIQERDAEIKALKLSQEQHDDEVRDINTKLVTARKALKPFLTKSKKWNWPADSIHALSPLTFGDLRAAKDAAAAIGVE